MKRNLTAILVFFFITLISFSQEKASITGTVKSENGSILFSASIGIQNMNIGTIADNDGAFKLLVPSEKKLVLIAYFLGYETFYDTLTLNPGEIYQVQIVLKESKLEIEEATKYGTRENASSYNTLDIKAIGQIPNSTGNLESMVKMMPGVTSNNDLTSQYSVRGGSFDENLIYVNDIEIQRPILVQSAQQEGLSFINPNMISSINFSSGGFDANYGDKMSSVLDIRYKHPTEFKGSAYASLIGAGVHVEGRSKDQKFTHLTGFRYKTTQFLLNTLDTKGDYLPTFTDFQTFLTYDLNKKLEVSFLGNISTNKYSLVPETRSSNFGTFSETYTLSVFYEGQEVDKFNSMMGALSLNYHPTENISLKIISSAFNSKEEVTYDILSEYFIGQLANSSSGVRDTLYNLGSGATLDHARNYLDAQIYSLEHKGSYFLENIGWKWGIKWQSEAIADDLNEWRYMDSAGFNSPYNGDYISLDYVARSKIKLNSNRYSAYLLNTTNFSNSAGNYNVSIGIRGQYWDYNKQFLISPRLNIGFKPYWSEQLSFNFATGLYYQAPFYKELRDPYGKIYQDQKAQRSIHFVLGSRYNFDAWERPFVFTSEIYYKSLSNLTPFMIDDVRVRYLPEFKALGYATGIDFKVYGEFVKGVESWFSLSLLSTKEDTYNDSYVKPDGTVVYPGYYDRPTNQTFTFSIFFQDYLPMNENFKMHLLFNYGSGLPYSGPDYDRPALLYPLGRYNRVDIGFSRVLLQTREKGFHDVWIAFEILNLFNSYNKSSYDWVRTVENNEGVRDSYAVPNYLTGRSFNIRISTQF